MYTEKSWKYTLKVFVYLLLFAKYYANLGLFWKIRLDDFCRQISVGITEIINKSEVIQLREKRGMPLTDNKIITRSGRII